MAQAVPNVPPRRKPRMAQAVPNVPPRRKPKMAQVVEPGDGTTNALSRGFWRGQFKPPKSK